MQENAREDSLEEDKGVMLMANDEKTSHIAVQHLLFLNKTIRTAKNQECVIRYTDITKCNDQKRIRLLTACDSALYSTKKRICAARTSLQYHIGYPVSAIQEIDK